MLWVLERTMSMRRFLEHPQHLLKLIGKKIMTILNKNWTYMIIPFPAIHTFSCLFSSRSMFLGSIYCKHYYTPPPPPPKLCGGYTVFTLFVRVCVRPCVRPSVTFCFLNILKSHGWIFIKPCKHVHICKTNTLNKKVRARGQFYKSYFPL